MNTEAFKLARATLRTAVKEYGWHRAGPMGHTCYAYGPGKFEGEHWSIVHFYDAMMNGCGGEEFYCGERVAWEVFEPDATEREAFGIAESNVVGLSYSESGFVSMEELTQCARGYH